MDKIQYDQYGRPTKVYTICDVTLSDKIREVYECHQDDSDQGIVNTLHHYLEPLYPIYDPEGRFTAEG